VVFRWNDRSDARLQPLLFLCRKCRSAHRGSARVKGIVQLRTTAHLRLGEGGSATDDRDTANLHRQCRVRAACPPRSACRALRALGHLARRRGGTKAGLRAPREVIERCGRADSESPCRGCSCRRFTSCDRCARRTRFGPVSCIGRGGVRRVSPAPCSGVCRRVSLARPQRPGARFRGVG